MEDQVERELDEGRDEEEQVIPSLNGQEGSVLDALRQRRARLQEERHLDYPVSGYDEKLVVRFTPVAVETLTRTAKKIDKMRGVSTPELLGATDVLLKACEQIMFKDPDHPLAEPDTGLVGLHMYPELETDLPIQFDERLADALKITEAKSARKILWSVFENNYAVMVAYNDLMDWQGDTDAAVDEALLGESKGREVTEFVATALALGCDRLALRFIESSDQVERLALEGYLRRATRISELREKHLAQKIASEVWKGVKF